MNQLTNQEIATVFALYYGCDFILTRFPDGGSGRVTGGIIQVANDRNNCKLLLTPLSAITDEDAIEVVMVRHNDRTWNKDKIDRMRASWYKQYATTEAYLIDANVHQYLISKSYAVPLWFGINHWANGKTAIELGIAIDKTKIETK